MIQEAADGKLLSQQRINILSTLHACRHDSSVLCSPRRTTRSTQVPCHQAEVWFDYCKQWWTETNPCCFTMWPHTHYQGLCHLFLISTVCMTDLLYSFCAVHRISPWQPNSVWCNPWWGYITPLCCMWVCTCWPYSEAQHIVTCMLLYSWDAELINFNSLTMQPLVR